MTDDLTPKELLTKLDGEALLKQIEAHASDKELPGLVGPDGKPLSSPAQDPQKLARERVLQMASYLRRMAKESEGFEDCLVAIVESYRMLFWSLSELMTHEGMDAALANLVSVQGRFVAQRDISLPDVIRTVKNKVVPYLQERNRFYAAEHGRRQAKLASINSRLSAAGIALPCHSLRDLFGGKPMFPPMSMVLRGKHKAVREALLLISAGHKAANGGLPVYLSSVAGEGEGAFASIVIPPAWWKNAASQPAVLESTLKSVVDSESVLLLVEDLEMLFTLGEGANTPLYRKAKAVATIYSWAYQHQVSLVIGDATEEDTPHPEVYGDLPHVAVSLLEADGKRHVVIGNDTLPVLEEAK